MIILNSKEKPNNSFHAAYLQLSDNDRIRIRTLALQCCEISVVTWYNWLKDFSVMKKPDRFVVAMLFGKDVKELFNPDFKNEND